MNTRIIELLEEATYDVLGVKQVDQKKFAELIVKECAEFANQHNQNKLYEDYDLGVGKAIKKHFGVEE